MSEDPVVATLFATHSEQYGEGVVHIIKSSSLMADEIVDGNVLKPLEREVALVMLPEEVAARSTTISTVESRSILSSMGIDLPRRVPSKEVLSEVLRETPRLDAEQIQQFLGRAQETAW